MTHPIIIAIDGPSASGKGTIAKKLATHFGLHYLDTGLLYRAVGMAVLRTGGDPSDISMAMKASEQIDVSTLSTDVELRSDKASVAASKVAAHPGVRDNLLQFQNNFCGRSPGAVLDGRDIGTVIAPHADVKIYVTASTDARAERRFKELQGRNENVTYAAVLRDLQERDARDASRSVAPAKPAADAVILDTTSMDAEAAFTEALRIASRVLAPTKT